MSSRWSKVLPPTPKASPYTYPAPIPEEDSPTGTPPASQRRSPSTPSPPISSPLRQASRPRPPRSIPPRTIPRKPVHVEDLAFEREEEHFVHKPQTPRVQPPRPPSIPSPPGVSVFGRRISTPKPKRPVLRKPVVPIETNVPNNTSPNGGSGRSERSYNPQSPDDPEVAVTAPGPGKKKPKGIVRFRLSALVVQGAQRLSRGTSAALARSSSLMSTMTKSSSATTIPRSPRSPIGIDVLHAGPGGLFEPSPDDNPLREVLKRANTNARYNTPPNSSNSSSLPSSTRADRQRPSRRPTDPRPQERKQPAPVAPPGPIAMADPASFPLRSVPRGQNPPTETSGHGRFVRNRIGMEAYFTEPVSPPPPTRPAPKTPVGQFLRAVWDLPWRSRSHVTVTYVPASAKPNGAAPDSWFRSKKACKDEKKSAPAPSPPKVVPNVETGVPRPRYLMRQDLVPNLPVKVYSSTAPPVLISRPGVLPLDFSPPQTWFYGPQIPP